MRGCVRIQGAHSPSDPEVAIVVKSERAAADPDEWRETELQEPQVSRVSGSRRS